MLQLPRNHACPFTRITDIEKYSWCYNSNLKFGVLEPVTADRCFIFHQFLCISLLFFCWFSLTKHYFMYLPNKIGKLFFEMYIKPIYSKRCLQESVNKKDKLIQKYKKTIGKLVQKIFSFKSI